MCSVSVSRDDWCGHDLEDRHTKQISHLGNMQNIVHVFVPYIEITLSVTSQVSINAFKILYSVLGHQYLEELLARNQRSEVFLEKSI